MHPLFLKFGPVTLHTYGVFVAVGFVLGLIFAASRAKQKGIDLQQINDLGLWLIVTGMGGAKIFYLLFFQPDFLSAWRAQGLASLREGFVFYGGFIGACVATILFCRRRKLSLWQVADAFAPAVALGHALGRLGCFFNGCCYGTVSNFAWAVQFPTGHVMHGIPVHPTQLYEVAGNLALLVGLLLSERRQRFAGQVWWLYVFGYGVLRFAIEFVRGDYEHRWLGVFSLGHMIAVGMILVSAVMWRFLARPSLIGHGNCTSKGAYS